MQKRASAYTAGGSTAERLNGEPTNTNLGFSTTRFVYDTVGCEVDRSFWNATAERALDDQGLATMRTAYDPQGHESEIAGFDREGKPTLGTMGQNPETRTEMRCYTT